MRRLTFVVFLICLCRAAFAQVPVQINSGNPAFPFPQFLPYSHPNGDVLYNLGTHNPAGVVHAEMEKSTRDAYQIMMNRADYYENISLGGTRYIKFRSNPDCSEGTGYAMLAAAMMADKVTFDGLWLFTHDFAMNNVIRHRDGSNSPAYDYSTLPGWQNVAGGNSAADGDFDIALALMIAHMQWGDNMGINNSRGQPISYKEDFLKVIKGLTDTLSFRQSNNSTLITGVIGLDGYFKGGDTWTELTGWATNPANFLSIGAIKPPNFAGPSGQYIDYTAPAYFRQFADYMRQDNAVAYDWNIRQFERAEVSSDWLMKRHHEQHPTHIPFAGWVVLNDTTPIFTPIQPGEDFRAPWRTILSYVWHGNPTYSWDPVRHVVVQNHSNTYLRDVASRYSRFLWDRRQAPWSQQCETIIGEGLWWGPSMVKWQYNPDGSNPGTYPLNWAHGTGSPAAIAAQDINLMSEMYRQCELEWDVETSGDRYLTSTPKYFHGFFRLLGMMTLTGNHHAPLNMKRQANMKVYLDVDKTYAFELDTITYTIDYRNYGADTARNVVITNRLHSDIFYISSTGGGTYDPVSNTVTWNLGTVPGFRTASGIGPTMGTMTLRVIVPYANQKRYENKVEITCSNGPGWTSNEYPNKISSVMKRNGFDIARRALRIDNSVYRDTVNPGMTAVYTIDFENSAEAGWLNGGRPGVNFTYAHDGTAATAGSHTFMIRAFNDAHEAYIDYGNYRISYFMFDNNYTGLGPNGWDYRTDIMYVPEAERANFRLLHENITPGEDPKGRWNQRLILQIGSGHGTTRSDTNWGTMAAPTQFLINYSGLDQRVHKGISTPFKGVWAVFAGNYATRNWGNDWSYNSRAVSNIATDAMANWGYPITPDFTENYDPDYPGKPVETLHRKLCEAPRSTSVDNILIEEWDGYTWRRVLGNGPLPGREVINVVIRDTVPRGATFLNFMGNFPFGIQPDTSRTTDDRLVITWRTDKLLVGEKGRIQYMVRADTPSTFNNIDVVFRAWAEADKESPTFSRAVLVVTRDSLPPPPPESTTMYKTANKTEYAAGDTINYTIAYKQTHGYPARSTASSQWTGTGAGNVSADGGTITFSNATNLRFTPSYGTNGTIGGTIYLTPYQPGFTVFARESNSGNGVELGLERLYIQSANLAGIRIIVSSNGTTMDTIAIPFDPPENTTGLDFKMVLQSDSLLLWFGDTSVVHPYVCMTGMVVREGHAGVRSGNLDWGTPARLTGLHTHFDLAYDVSIRDTIPFGIRYIEGSATGRINTVTPPRDLSATVSSGSPRVITWPVVSGTGPTNALGANDSLTLTWRGVVDTARNRMTVNTAYTDLLGYARDAIGAYVRTSFVDYTPPDTNVIPPDTSDIDSPMVHLEVRATPAGCIFTDSVVVTLRSLPGASIWYTTNGTDPVDTLSFPPPRRYVEGQPVVFRSHTTLMARAYAPRSEPSPVAEHVYEPLRTVPVQSAIFFDNIGDGLAHGIKLVLGSTYLQRPDSTVIRNHLDLFDMPGLPAISSLQFVDDTVVIHFSGSGIEPSGDARMTIREPQLPTQTQYTSSHGYLAARTLNIIDGVAPVIVEAIYYPSLAGIETGSGVSGDTLVITFNKYAALSATSGPISPFVFSYAGGTYELELGYIRHDRNSVYFSVISIGGPNPVVIPSQGDSVRIKTGGEVLNIYSDSQENVNNKAVALKIRYPDLNYVVKLGPSPFKDSLNVWITVEPYLQAVFDELNPRVRVYDMMGNIVAITGKNLKVEVSDSRYVLVWNGRNIKGRRAASGTYLIYVIVTDQNGGKKTLRQRVYLYR